MNVSKVLVQNSWLRPLSQNYLHLSSCTSLKDPQHLETSIQNLVSILLGYTPKGIKAKGIKAKGINFANPKVLKIQRY